MEPLELKPETASCLISVMLSLFFALVWALLCCVMGTWGFALAAALFPLPFLLWWQWQWKRAVVFYPDHLENRTWFSTQTVPYAGTGAELQTRVTRFSRAAGNGHLPLLTICRDATVEVSVPRSLHPGPDVCDR